MPERPPTIAKPLEAKDELSLTISSTAVDPPLLPGIKAGPGSSELTHLPFTGQLST